MIILKILSLFIALLFTFVNIGRLITKQNISSTNFIMMAVGWTSLISLMFFIN